MNKKNSILKMKQYRVGKIFVDNLDETLQLDNYGFEFGAKNIDENNFSVMLTLKDDAENPKIEASILADFELENWKSYQKNEPFKRAYTIIFPFLRSLVADITVKVCSKPLVLPIINIEKILETSIKDYSEDVK